MVCYNKNGRQRVYLATKNVCIGIAQVGITIN